MWKFITRRILLMIPQLFLLSLIVFLLAKAMPGDALTGAINDPGIDRETIAEMREEMGLNNPWYVQYMEWAGHALTGDFGVSYTHKIPVSEIVAQRLVNTFWLSLTAVVFVYIISIPLGIISGRWNDSLVDRMITGYTYIGFAAPLFIFALIMLFIFGFQLGWFPTGGKCCT
ncbi:ABC-type dipeptide/oligopeptide/nickel transport system permease component [Salibacterium salarium]|nr:ABC-type dipeptide/oligopeptide/nickel transport system permease component [Salibacterium salarium]